MLDALPLLGVWFLAVITPGPDFVVVVQHTTSRSRRHGVVAAAGISTAILVWAMGSMLGLSVLLTRLSWLYEIVRLAGAAYLVYLGARTLWASRHRGGRGSTHGGAADRDQLAGPAEFVDDRGRAVTRHRRQSSLGRSWRIGFLTNASNPKAVAFFGSLMGALLPPHPSVEVRAFVIAGIVLTALVWYLVVATMFGAAPVARLYRRVRRWVDRVTAAILILLGGRLALER